MKQRREEKKQRKIKIISKSKQIEMSRYEIFWLQIVIVVSVVVVITVTGRQFISHAPHIEPNECSAPDGRRTKEKGKKEESQSNISRPHWIGRACPLAYSQYNIIIGDGGGCSRTRVWTKNDSVMVKNPEMKNKKQRKTRQQTENYK